MKLVFASGFLIPQHPPGINYFRDLKDHVEAQGHETVFPDVGPLDSCEKRAIPLADQIYEKYKDGEIHIIAHSMGGLDSRVLIYRNHRSLSERIKSLTTIATPHAGSPIADLLTGGKRRGGDDLLGAAAKLISANGLSIDALEDLRTDRTLPDPRERYPDIGYFSYAAVGRPVGGILGFRTCFPLALTHSFIGGENDGLVALSSAQYGKFQKGDLWHCDHADAVGWNLDNPLRPEFPHLAHYDAIISRLEA
jgi:triacylglycerol lipase